MNDQASTEADATEPRSLNGWRRIFENTGWILADRVFRMGLGAAIGIWIARHLGAADYGLFNFSRSFVALFAAFATLGLDRVLAQELVLKPGAMSELLGTTTALRAAGALTAGILAFTVAMVAHGEDAELVLLVLTFSLSGIPDISTTIAVLNESRLEQRSTFTAQALAFALASVLRVLAIVSDAPVIAFAVCVCIERTLVAVGLAAIYLRTKDLPKLWKWSSARARTLLGQSWPLIVSTALVVIYMRSDVIMLGEMSGDEAVGVYSAATQLSEIWYFVPAAIVSSVMPGLLSIRTSEPPKYRARVQALLEFLWILAIGIAIPCSFVSVPLMTLLFGEDFADAGNVLSIHIWSAVFVFQSYLRAAWLLAGGHQRLSLVTVAIGACVNIGLNTLLIPAYGPSGAAWATLVSQCFAVFLGNVLFAPTREFAIQQMRSVVPIQLIRWGLARRRGQ